MKIKVRSGIKAGSITLNHNRTRLKIRSGVKAGSLTTNHNHRLLGS
jgi:hypothetical protein